MTISNNIWILPATVSYPKCFHKIYQWPTKIGINWIHANLIWNGLSQIAGLPSQYRLFSCIFKIRTFNDELNTKWYRYRKKLQCGYYWWPNCAKIFWTISIAPFQSASSEYVLSVGQHPHNTTRNVIIKMVGQRYWRYANLGNFIVFINVQIQIIYTQYGMQ